VLRPLATVQDHGISNTDTMQPRETLEAFDRYIAVRGLRLRAVVVGGAALNLLGVIARATKDCDILHPAIPPEIATAARSFATELRSAGDDLQDDWLNNGPASLADVLPPGWEERLEPVLVGQALELRCLGRSDLLLTKLFALCDRGIDLLDCVALAPSSEELAQLSPWVERQDANADWPAHVRATLADLERRLRRGV